MEINELLDGKEFTNLAKLFGELCDAMFTLEEAKESARALCVTKKRIDNMDETVEVLDYILDKVRNYMFALLEMYDVTEDSSLDAFF